MPKISVCIATYNSARFIIPQLISLMNQRYQLDEVIVSDDCSTDNTVELVTDFISDNFLGNWKLHLNPKNVGYVENFYRALKMATGDIIFLCDHDDIWYNEKVEVLTEYFYLYPAALCINSSFEVIDAQGNSTARKSRSRDNNGLLNFKNKSNFSRVPLSSVIRSNTSPGCAVAFRRELRDDYIRTSRRKMPHDWEINILAAQKNELYYLDFSLMGYRIHGGNEIGITSGKNFSLKMNTSATKRLKICDEQMAHADLMGSLSFSAPSDKMLAKRFKRFTENRNNAIRRGSFLAAIKNIFVYSSVRSIANVRFRGVIGDILVALKHNKS